MNEDTVKRYVVTGGSNGIGSHLVDLLLDEPGVEVAILDVVEPQRVPTDSWFWLKRDVTLYKAHETHLFGGRPINGLVNCAGINEINWLADTDPNTFQRIMDVNVFGTFNMVQQLLPQLHGGLIANVVSNASHVPMTASVAYNASKGAAHIMTLQMARELHKSHDIAVMGFSPAKVKGTRMSQYIDKRVPVVRGWTKDYSRKYQTNALVAGKEIPVRLAAEVLWFMVNDRERAEHFSGTVVPYGA